MQDVVRQIERSKVPGEFTMADLLRFVGDISPIDGISTV